jgi:hypothetical protein
MPEVFCHLPFVICRLQRYNFLFILQKKRQKYALFSEKSRTFAVSKAEIEVINI